MVVETITSIENWFTEPSNDQKRSILLSKLAIIELCGWIEEWMDGVIKDLDQKHLNDPEWTKEMIELTNGFHYDKHFRPMLCKMLGEFKVRHVEIEFDQKHPGSLENIKSTLGTLWKRRCTLAHADIAAHQAAQIKIEAPSWTKNQYRTLSKKLDFFKTILLEHR